MKLFVPNPEDLPLVHSDYPWYNGSPDAIVVADDFKSGDNAIGGVDFKTTGYSHLDEWGEAGTDQIPEYYHCQAMWYMGLTGAQWWDIAVLFMGARREFRIYRINRDQELIDSLIQKGKDFWENHVMKQEPPPVDAAPGWDKYFKSKWPKEEEDYLESSPDIGGDIQRLWIMDLELDKLEKEITGTKNKIKSYIGDHAGIKSSLGRIQWKKNCDTEVVDYKAIFEYLYDNYVDQENEDKWESKKEIIKKFTTTRPGARVFKSYWNKGDK